MTRPLLPVLSLFCGAGGLDLGFRQAHFRPVLACDVFPAAVKSYNLNTRNKVARLINLSTTSPEELTALLEAGGSVPPLVGVIGGPPCQGFSRGNARSDPDDERNLLPFVFAEHLKNLNKMYNLQFFVFENVMGLMTAKYIEQFNSIKARFEDAGFVVFCKDLNANRFGVAQNRRRLFIVGFNDRYYHDFHFNFPEGRSEPATVRQVIQGLPYPAYFKRGLTSKDIPYHRNHWTMRPVSAKLLSGERTDGRSFRRLPWDEESPTIAYGNREIHVHPDGGRRLTIHEAMLLQGFPPNYRLAGNFSEQVTQVSNAVPPPMARALARAIRKVVATWVQDRRNP